MSDFSLDFLPDELAQNDEAEVQIIEMIRSRVATMLDTNPELLFSYLYRLDVEEHKIDMVLKTGGANLDVALANLIWNRQVQRLKTKKEYGQPLDIDPSEME
jgi:hypothetical protein